MQEKDIEKDATAGSARERDTAAPGQAFPIWIGLDVSKDSFTAALWNILGNKENMLPPKARYSFDRKDISDFLDWARKAAGAFQYGIAMEATGIYSKKLLKALHDAAPELHVAVCNPKSVSFYMRSYTEEKNDFSDAIYIARYACDRQPAATCEKDPVEAKLQELVRERNRQVEELQRLRNGLEALTDKTARSSRMRLIRAYEKEIKNLDKSIKAVVGESKEISHEVELMSSFMGVGTLSASCIYGELGSLKNYTRKQISAVSGVCPVNKLSGTSVQKHTMSRQGSKLLRKILYLDCNQAISRIPSMAEFHRRMLEKPNSSKMSARCACMRKILLILHAMVVNDTKFDPNYKSQKIVKNLSNPA